VKNTAFLWLHYLERLLDGKSAIILIVVSLSHLFLNNIFALSFYPVFLAVVLTL